MRLWLMIPLFRSDGCGCLVMLLTVLVISSCCVVSISR
jgi:hypothetical protein